MERIKGITNKQFAAMVAIMLFIAIISIFISNCNCAKNHVKSKIDSTDFKLMKSFIEKKLIKDNIKKHDSIDKVLINIDTIFIDRWHKAKEISKQAPDTCQHYIEILEHACDSMRLNLEAVILNLRLINMLKDSLQYRDSTDIAMLYKVKEGLEIQLSDALKELEKVTKQKKNWRTAAIIEGGYIILREGKSVLLN